VEEEKARRLAIMQRRARILLKELGIEPRRLRMVPNLPYLVLECEMPDEPIRISFPLNKLGRRVLREIYWHWLPGVDSGTIRLSHVLELMLIFGPPRVIYRYRSRIRRRTGLARDPKLRNFVIWRRIKATERFRERISPKGPLALCHLASPPSHRDGASIPHSNGPGRGGRCVSPRGPLASEGPSPSHRDGIGPHTSSGLGKETTEHSESCSSPKGSLARKPVIPSRRDGIDYSLSSEPSKDKEHAPKGPLAFSRSSPSHRDGFFTTYSSGPGRGENA